MIAFVRVPQSPAQTRYHHCPRCGSRLSHDERAGTTAQLARLFFLRALRCKPNCGWHGLRFSRSLLRRRRRHLTYALFVMLFVATAAVTVRYLLARAASGQGSTGDEGIQEVE